MHSLANTQANVIDTINNGPDMLDPSLFAGPRDRILLGLKAHANTINYARILALEETFPRTRQEMGEAAFNKLVRDFVETDTAKASDTNRIGSSFPSILTNCDVRTGANRMGLARKLSYRRGRTDDACRSGCAG